VFETDFLTRNADSFSAYQQAVRKAAATLVDAMPEQPYSGRSPAELTDLLGVELGGAAAQELDTVLRRVQTIIRHSIVPSHPHTAAHLHCPPLIASLAAEAIVCGLNQSMDSFDQAPAATMVEQGMIQALCRRAGLPATAAGTFTAGGTQSNYMGLWLARDAYLHAHDQWSAQKQGLPPEARRFRILCSEAAHFTVEKSAAQLGLGTDAVLRVPVDSAFRMSVADLQARLEQLQRQALVPIAIVATAGTTDFGSIDPLAEIAELARACGAWFHVDAAYGGALLFSSQHADRLRGLELADSLTMDFHKLFWQPISCGAFLLRDAAHFERIKLHADYLNPEGHAEEGIPDLVTRSPLTTRRFDALKLWVSLQVLGSSKLAALIDQTLQQAQEAAALIRRHKELELLSQPTLGCVLFRYRPQHSSTDIDALNQAIRRRLFEDGQAVIGQTCIRGERWLKLTLLNPCTQAHHLMDLLEQVAQQGIRLEPDFTPSARSWRIRR